MASTSLTQAVSNYEQVYVHMSRAFKPLNKEHWAEHCLLKLEYTSLNLQQELLRAWKALACEYPGLRTEAVELSKQAAATTTAVIEEFATKTFHILNSSSENAETIMNESRPRSLPMLYLFPETSELLFISQHWRTDALGCCMLLNRLFTLMTSATSFEHALENARDVLSPSMEIALQSPTEPNIEIQESAKKRIAEFHENAVHSGGLPFQGNNTTPPGLSKLAASIFSENETSQIVAACKHRQISVSAAIHTALAEVYFLQEKDDQKKQNGYTTIFAVSMRPFLPIPYNDSSHACQTYVSSITPTVPHVHDFTQSAEVLTKEYKFWFSEDLRSCLYWIYKYNAEKMFAPKPADAKPAPVKPPSGVTLSSLGIIEKHLNRSYGDKLKINGFSFGVSIMTRQTILYAWTFRGQLTLSLNYNDAYYSPQMVTDILDSTKTFLLKGLKII